MANSNISIKYRPVRVGFLIGDGSTEDLRKAVQINTILWGGIYNPIIPVNKNHLDYAKRLIDLFRVDILYKVSETDEIKQLHEDYPWLRDPSHFGGKILGQYWDDKLNPTLYDVSHIYNYYWEKQYKGNKRKGAALYNWNNSDVLDSFYTTVFGSFPYDKNIQIDYKADFRSMLSPKCIDITSAKATKVNDTRLTSPIEATGVVLKPSANKYYFTSLYIGNPKDIYDLVEYWNIRASGSPCEFIPLGYTKKYKSFVKTFIKNVDVINNTARGIPRCIYALHNCPNKEFTQAISDFTPKKKPLVPREIQKYSWVGLPVPLDFNAPQQQVISSIEDVSPGYRITIPLPKNGIFRNADDSYQSIIVNINSYTDYAHDGYTLKLPYFRKLNEYYSRSMTYDPRRVRVGKEDTGVVIKANDVSVDVYPINKAEIIKQIFGLINYKANHSQAGIITKRIIESFGAVDSCRIFKITGVRKLIHQVKVGQSVTLSKARQIIWDDGSFKRFKDLYIEPRTKPKLDNLSVFRQLLQRKIFRPVLLPLYKIFPSKVIFRCRHCLLKQDVNVSVYQGYYECEICKTRHYMPDYVVEDFLGKKKKYLQYRTDGFFSKDNNQEGAIPVILSLLVFQRIVRGSLFYSTSLELKGMKNLEVDFTIIHKNFSKMEIGIGECKSSYYEIDEKDVDNLSNIQDKLIKLGIDCYMIFAKTADNFSEKELELFRGLRDANRRFILLTNKEMEPYEPYWKISEEIELPNKYVHDLEDMHQNSIRIYLNDNENDA